MIYIYSDGSGKFNCICDGILKSAISQGVRKNMYKKEVEYTYFDILYNYDEKARKYMQMRCLVLNPPAARMSKYMHKHDRVLLFGTILVDKRKSKEFGGKRYMLLVSSILHMNEIYSLIEKAHVNDNFEAKIISQYRNKKKRKANEIDLMGEAEKILSADDVLI